MSRDDPYIRLRVPEDLRNELKDLAAKNRRSMNAEICARLVDSLQRDKAATASESLRPGPVGEQLSLPEIEARVVKRFTEHIENWMREVEARGGGPKKPPRKK